MTIKLLSGTAQLVLGVRAYFAAHAVTAKVAVGWKARHHEDQGPGQANRVVIMPGDPSGKGGKLVQPREPGERYIGPDPERPVGTVRPIADWDRLLTISVWAWAEEVEGDDPLEVEFKQTVAVEDLIEWVKRAVDYVALANVEWGEITWVLPKERTFGCEALIGLTFRHPLCDVPRERAYPGFTISKPAG